MPGHSHRIMQQGEIYLMIQINVEKALKAHSQKLYKQDSHLTRAAFKFGRGVHFALRRTMRKPPISRVPAILNGLTYRPS